VTTAAPTAATDDASTTGAAGAGAGGAGAATPLPRPVTPMGILAARLDRVAAALVGGDVDPAVLAELDRVRELAAGLEPYLDRCTSPESPALHQLAERTRDTDWGGFGSGGLEQEMLSGHVEGRFLAFLVQATRARRVLEVGLFTGYSALAMAEALPPGGTLLACEVDPGVAAFARSCLDDSPAGAAVQILLGPALDTLRALAGATERFDLVFIDADKTGYPDYLAAVLYSGLLAPGGTVCVDNTLLQGEPWAAPGPAGPSANGAAIAAFNASVAADPRLVQVVVPLRDGITLIRRVDDGPLSHAQQDDSTTDGRSRT